MRTEPTPAGEQIIMPCTPGRTLPKGRRGAKLDRGWSGLPLSPEGREALKTEQAEMFKAERRE